MWSLLCAGKQKEKTIDNWSSGRLSGTRLWPRVLDEPIASLRGGQLSSVELGDEVGRVCPRALVYGSYRIMTHDLRNRIYFGPFHTHRENCPS
jgi:hypothetical protein